MTSSVVAIGSNQLWSFTPATDLLDEQANGRLETPKLVPPTTSSNNTASIPKPTTIIPSSKSTINSLDAIMAKFALSKSSTNTTAASSTSSDVNPDAISSLNLLIIESGDILHALKTLIQQHRHIKTGEKPPPTHFYILDNLSSSTARHLLLLAIAFDTSLSLRGRTELFLEVYGNALIQEKTQIYINRKVKEIRIYLSSLSTLTTAAPPSPLGASLFRNLVDLSHLKNKELDEVESALDFFTTPNTRPSQKSVKKEADSTSKENDDSTVAALPSTKSEASSDALARVLPQKDPNAFDIETLRDHRLRGYFGDRFDARANLVDWDYHMRLKAVASIIHVIHYKKWRLLGIAFEERLCTYTYPNRTFATYREAKSKTRGSVSVRGYWSDTLVSPYISLGVEANEKRLFQRKNHQHTKTSPHVCEYNLLSLLYELETGTPYQLPKKADDGKKKLKPAGEKKSEEDDEIVQLPDEVELTTNSTTTTSTSSSSSSTITLTPSSQPIVVESNSSGDSTTLTLSHTTPTALSLDHVKLIFLNGSVKTLATKRRYASLFDRIYISQTEVGCINESAAATVAAEVKKQQSSATTSTTSAPTSTAPTPVTPPIPIHELPLNKMSKLNAVITIETVKFLPVTPEVKSAYLSRVRDLALSAGWSPAIPPSSPWSSIDSYHSWSDREIEQPTEVEEKKEANEQPARIHFVHKG